MRPGRLDRRRQVFRYYIIIILRGGRESEFYEFFFSLRDDLRPRRVRATATRPSHRPPVFESAVALYLIIL